MNLMNLEILWTESRILQATDNIINLLKLLMYILQTTNWFLMIPIKMKLDERQKHVKPYFQPDPLSEIFFNIANLLCVKDF